MFLPHHHRMLSLIVFGYLAWQFLSLGVVLSSGGLVLSFQSRVEGALLAPLGLWFLQIGAMAVDHLRSLDGPLAR